ncbi:MAG: hypothetical protein WBW81_06515, partial [Methylocella sp.]
MPGDGIHRRKLAHHLAKTDGDVESGLDGLACLREKQRIEAEFEETCPKPRVDDVDARKIFEQSCEFGPDRCLA